VTARFRSLTGCNSFGNSCRDTAAVTMIALGDLRQHGVFRPVEDLYPGRDHKMRQMRAEIGRREWRRDPENLPDANPDEHGDERDRRALVAHQREHQRRNRHPEPDLGFDGPDAERGER